MDGFLVLLVHKTEDLPIRFFFTHRMAVKFALKVSAEPEEFIRDLFCTDCSTPVCVKVVEFRDGKPLAVDMVKEFDEAKSDGELEEEWTSVEYAIGLGLSEGDEMFAVNRQIEIEKEWARRKAARQP